MPDWVRGLYRPPRCPGGAGFISSVPDLRLSRRADRPPCRPEARLFNFVHSHKLTPFRLQLSINPNRCLTNCNLASPACDYAVIPVWSSTHLHFRWLPSNHRPPLHCEVGTPMLRIPRNIGRVLHGLHSVCPQSKMTCWQDSPLCFLLDAFADIRNHFHHLRRLSDALPAQLTQSYDHGTSRSDFLLSPDGILMRLSTDASFANMS